MLLNSLLSSQQTQQILVIYLLIEAPGGVSNGTRAVVTGGTSPAATNVIEFFTIATTGNSADFGDAANVVNGKTGAASPTRGICWRICTR